MVDQEYQPFGRRRLLYFLGMPDCIFCPNPADSVEHVFPQWVLDRKKLGPSRFHFGNRPERVADIDLTVKSVCGACNNGWMSDLENDAKPILQSMFGDRKISLDQNNQVVLIAWLMKIVFLNDTTRGRDAAARFYRREETLAFGKSREMPNFTMVSIGHLTDIRRAITGTQFKTTDERGTLTGLATTLTNEHLVAQIVTLSLEPEPEGPATIELTMAPGNWDSMLSRIWHPEPSQIDWPPAVSFTNSGPTAYAHLLDRFRIGQRVAPPVP